MQVLRFYDWAEYHPYGSIISGSLVKKCLMERIGKQVGARLTKTEIRPPALSEISDDIYVNVLFDEERQGLDSIILWATA